MAVEARRGCGFRKIGGLYVVGGGLSAPCDRMPFPLDRCKTCGGGIKFTRGPQWLQPDFFTVHGSEWYCPDCKTPTTVESHTCSHGRAVKDYCNDESSCPVCRNRDDFGPHLLLWIGRGHYSPDAYLKESREMGVSRRLSAMPKGLVLGETWVLLAHLDAVPPKDPKVCTRCSLGAALHPNHPDSAFKKDLFKGGAFTFQSSGEVMKPCEEFQAPKPTPGIFCAFVPRAVELILKESDATPERREKEEKRGVTVVTVPDDDKDHQGSVWDKDEEDSQPELPAVSS